MKIVIVGSDGRKFNEEQEIRAKTFIWNLLAFGVAKQEKLTDEDLKAVSSDWDRKKQIVVSGHCPVGEELWYCVECDQWIVDVNKHIGYHREPPNQWGVKVYDKGGIDTWAEIIATKLGISTKIFPAVCTYLMTKGSSPEECLDYLHSMRISGLGHMWGYHYKPRNIEMAQIGDIGYTIEVAGSCRHCSGTGKQKKADEEGDGWYYDSRESCNKCKGTGAYSGGTFTINEMKKLGKEVHQVIIK